MEAGGWVSQYFKHFYFLAAAAVVDRCAESQNSWCEGLDTDSGYQASRMFSVLIFLGKKRTSRILHKQDFLVK